MTSLRSLPLWAEIRTPSLQVPPGQGHTISSGTFVVQGGYRDLSWQNQMQNLWQNQCWFSAATEFIWVHEHIWKPESTKNTKTSLSPLFLDFVVSSLKMSSNSFLKNVQRHVQMSINGWWKNGCTVDIDINRAGRLQYPKWLLGLLDWMQNTLG